MMSEARAKGKKAAKNGGPTGKPKGFIDRIVACMSHESRKLLLFEGLAKTLTARRSLTTGVGIVCF
jgi:hypothetical protein